MALRFSPEALRDARCERDITKSDLARRLETAWQSVHSYERGQAAPTMARLCQLADILDVPVSRFFADDDDA